MSEPRRLIEQEAASELGSALRQARAATGDDAQIARLWQKLGQPAAVPAPASTTASDVARLSAVKGAAVIALVGLGALGWLAYVLGGDREPQRATRAASAPSGQAALAAPARASTMPPERAEPAVAAAVDEPTVRPAATPRAPRVRAAQTPAARERAAVDPEAELALLTRAEQALELTPEAALAILREHAQRFPDGVLAQEREILSIDAELALGRKPAAAARARAFVARFPSSAHRHRFASLLSGSEPRSGDHKPRAQPIPTE